jgi:transcriptional regulator with GAF, ATPase, and Fis domain
MTFERPADRLRLVALSGPLAGVMLPLAGEEVTIGRDPASGVSLADRSLSRAHCALRLGEDGWTVRDLGSANGTFVNGLQVEQQLLREGDQITAGESVFLLFLRPLETDAAAVEFVAAAPGMTTTRLRLEDAQYLQPASPPSTGGSPGVEQHLRALLKFSTAISSIRHETELFDCVLDHIVDAVPNDAAAVVLVNERGEMTDARFRPSPSTAVPVNRALLAQVIGEGVGIVCREPSPGHTSASGDLQAAPAESLCVPLMTRGHAMGVLYVTHARARTVFDESHLQLATAIASIASIALDNVRHLAAIEREVAGLRADLHITHNLVGNSEPMQRVYELVARVARSETTAIILGETGTGKELVARALHRNSTRARGPFVAINCAALTESLLESELFGHERGAFTGAVTQKKGRLEIADGGTVFLDEVAELAPALQSKLLRVLQEHTFERVGGTRSIAVNIRIISATNRRLAAEVAAGRFREDLFFRLHVIPIEMPPLRERGNDIALLADHFISHYAEKIGRAVSGMSPSARQRLMAYAWPGNVRELENAIERAIVLGSTSVILPEDLPESLLEIPSGPGRELPRFHEAVIETKKRVIVDAFRHARRSYVETARLLGLNPNYLHRVIRNLELKDQLESDR